MVPAVEQIDGAWLTEVLQGAGVARGAHITGFTTQSIGTGQVGDNVRFTLEWSDPADRPQTIVVKLPSANELSRATAAATMTYVREVGFYRDVKPHVSINTPTPYYVDEDRAANSFVLVMNDLAPAEQGDQIIGCSLAEARYAIEQAAALHASTWGKTDQYLPLDWVDDPAPERVLERVAMLGVLWTGFRDRYMHRMTEAELAWGEWLMPRLPAMASSYRGERCLTHNDFRLDNMLFTDDGVTVVDWQTVGIGYGPTDVAYFVGAGLLPQGRRGHEVALVEHYISALRTHGVDVVEADIWHNYKLGTASGYLMAVFASQLVGQTERGDDMFMAMASRHADQMECMGLRDLID